MPGAILLPQSPQRIAIIKPSALGDIVHSLPVLSALRQRFPMAHLAWIVNRGYAPLLENHPDLNEIVLFERGVGKGPVRSAWIFTAFLNGLRGHGFDMAIDLQGLLRTGMMSLASGAACRIGLASAREGANWCYSHRVDDRTGSRHAVDRYWRVIEALGDPPPHKSFHVPVQPLARAWARETLRQRPRPWVAVGVGSRWQTKRWPPEHFAALAQQMWKRFGGTSVFVGAPEESELAEKAAALVDGPTCQLAGKTTLPQLVAVLGEVDAMVANDTGPLHLAAALGRPVLAPYTCTLVERTGPYGQMDHAVQASIWCRGSYLKQCPLMDCMAELTPDRLWPVLESILQTWQQQFHAA